MLDQIIIDIAPILEGNHEIEKSTIIHDSDPSGKSKIVEKQWVLQNGDRVLVQCYNFDVSFNSENNNLSISIRSKEFHNFLRKLDTPVIPAVFQGLYCSNGPKNIS